MNAGNGEESMKPLIFISLMVALIGFPGHSAAQNSGLGLSKQIMTVRLLTPISTTTNHPGDTFSATVLSPPAYAGGVIQGRVDFIRRPEAGFGKSRPQIQLHFESLSWNGRTFPIQVDLTGVSNSSGVQGVDEEGHVIGRTSKKKRIAGATSGGGVGALIGGLRGGPSGAIAGALAGVVTGYVVTAELTSEGSDIDFKPGAIFTLQVSDAVGRRHQLSN